jgi:hypothetical protein
MLPIISPFLSIVNQLKVYHWQTYSFSEHKSFGDVYDSLSGKIDEFVEAYQGIFGRVIAEAGFFEFSVENFSPDHVATIDGWISYLKSFSEDENLNRRSDLLNIRDEMLADLNKLKYLLTLN